MRGGVRINPACSNSKLAAQFLRSMLPQLVCSIKLEVATQGIDCGDTVRPNTSGGAEHTGQVGTPVIKSNSTSVTDAPFEKLCELETDTSKPGPMSSGGFVDLRTELEAPTC